MIKKLALGCLTLIIGSAALLPAAVAADTVNLITNPSVETAQDAATPQGWIASTWGNNTTTFSYPVTGHTGTRSIGVTVSNYADGAANWYYADLPVTAGTTYSYSDWYQSTVDTEVDAEVLVNGTLTYYNLGTAFANTAWTQFKTTFTVPTGGTAMAIYQTLAKNGTLTSDDYSLSVYAAQPFTRAIVSVSFDDGWLNQLQNAEPLLLQNHIPATYYIISGETTTPDSTGYMTAAQVQSLANDGNGNEIASHTVHHCDLTGVQTDNATNCPTPISAAQVQSEMTDSKTALQTLTGKPVTDFAYPYGTYNATTIADGIQAGYLSQRTVNAGFNAKDTFDATQLKIQEVDSNITTAQVQSWVDSAIANKTWLILVYHEIATTPNDPSDAQYTTQPADFTTEMNYIKTSGVTTETVAQALAEASAQVAGTAGPVISGVTTSAITGAGVTIGWTTNVAGTTQVAYGLTNTYGSTTTLDATLVTAHTASLTGLTANTAYHYQVISKDAAGNTTVSPDATFTTTAAKAGDANGDGKVNALDLSILSSHWNTASGATLAQGDFNGDGKVNAVDLSILSSNWGK